MSWWKVQMIIRGYRLDFFKARRQHARSLNLLRRQLTDDQRAQVMRDMRQDGMTIREIAKTAGVGVATVHRAIAGDVPNGTNYQLDDFEEEYEENSLTPEPVNLTPDVVAEAILAKPELSDRALAKEVGVSNVTVSSLSRKGSTVKPIVGSWQRPLRNPASHQGGVDPGR